MDQTAEASRAAPVAGVMARVLLLLIDAYRFLLSPLLGSQCRFHPTCSRYARDAIVSHGALRGSGLALTRVCRCHPWSPGGLDEVPPRHTNVHQKQSLAAERTH